MRDSNTDGEANLAWQALLYASGELDETQRAAFEERLGHDQAVRDALSLAVPFATVPRRPDPAYREVVRRRLGLEGPWKSLLARRTYRGHPILWAVGGAAAAVFLTVGLSWSAPFFSGGGAREPAASPSSLREDAAAQAAPSLEAATIWADITPSDHLLKARGEELRRKNREEELRRLVHSESRRTRMPVNPCDMH
jgi:hypothetical protein